ncbi:MAG: lytic murein transglycosylase, partial [Solirubrobacteraceae bacterium]
MIGPRLVLGLAAAGVLAVGLGAGAAPGLGQETTPTGPTTATQPEPPSLGTFTVPVDEAPARSERGKPRSSSSSSSPARERADRKPPGRKGPGGRRGGDGAPKSVPPACAPEERLPSDEQPDEPRERTAPDRTAAAEANKAKSKARGKGKSTAQGKAETENTCRPPKDGAQLGAAKEKRNRGAKQRNRSRRATPSGAPAIDRDGKPSLANPGVSVTDPGPARVGVPSFMIDKFRIPPFLLPIYKAAEAQYGISWQVLAAVNEIETDYGRNLNVSTAGAVGWMQFLPSTWKAYGTDANGDRKRDPYNPVDAIFSAARYIKAAGGEKSIRRGLFAYNNANWYVDSVLLRAKVIGGLPDDLVGGLTELTQGRFPVAARARYANRPPRRGASPQSIEIFTKAGAPVVAVNDGIVRKIGLSRRLGRYVILEDWSGNRYLYARLGRIAGSYPAPREDRLAKEDQPVDELALAARRDPKPIRPASAGRQRGAAPGPSARTAASPAAGS